MEQKNKQIIRKNWNKIVRYIENRTGDKIENTEDCPYTGTLKLRGVSKTYSLGDFATEPGKFWVSDNKKIDFEFKVLKRN